jgi:hypothetical protein
LFVTIAASACSSSDNGIWMPPGGSGKADGYTTIRGSDIPSAYVDANKSYMIWRNIANLSTVGAFDMTQAGLAKRVDGIIANMPSDGQMHVAELVRMEDPTIHSSLYPAEQQALPKLWKLMEAPDSNDTLYGPADQFGVLDASAPPAAAVPPTSLAISSLSSELQAPASRLENVYDSDSDASTVTLTDLANGVANPASFTPTEIASFKTIQAVFRDKAVAQSTAQLVISPGPGTFTKDATLGSAAFHMTGTTKLDETRSVYYTTLSASLTATQSVSATVALASGAQVLVLAQDTGTETVFGAGTVPNLGHDEYVFEVWQGGQRMFATNVDMPAMTTQNTITLNDKLDYTIASGLNPLVRNLNSSTATYSGGYYTYAVHYTYDKTTITPPAGQSQPAVTATTSPTVTIPVGRYSFPQSSAVLYVYPNNVLWFGYGSQQYRLIPQGNNGSALTRFQVQSGLSVSFDTTNNYLYCSSCNPVVSVTLNSSMRDI